MKKKDSTSFLPSISELDHLIYDWNQITTNNNPNPVFLLDESLRDGLQSPSVVNPPVQIKFELIKLMCELGIDYLDLGYPGASEQALKDTIYLAKMIVQNKLPITISCAARTHPHDINATIEVSQAAGVPVELLTFLGSSPIRGYVEKWDINALCQKALEAVKMGIDANLPVAFVTEDTIRSSPQTLEPLFKTAINAGAERLILCDTVGHGTPQGVTALVSWTRALIKRLGTDTKLDWHGHNDRGLAVINTLYAMQSGCDRLHATALGIGERTGNTAMDLLLVNLKLLGIIQNDLSHLLDYCQLISKATGINIPENYPIIGRDAFRTATGVHAAAILKAKQLGKPHLEDLIYSSIPASMVGRKQQIEIGPMSGKANVIAWLSAHEIMPDTQLVSKILDAAKKVDQVLEDEDLFLIIKQFKNGTVYDKND